MTATSPPDPRVNLGETLTQLRRGQRLSIAALAESSGISRQHVWRIEKGKVPSPGKEILERLAVALEVSVSSLVPASGGRDRVLNILLQNASRIPDADWLRVENVAWDLMSGPAERSQKRVQGHRPLVLLPAPSPLSEDDQARIPDDIQIIAQFLAEREGFPMAWRSYAKDAFRLRLQLKKRGAKLS